MGSTALGSFNPIGTARIKLNGGNLVLDSKGNTLAGLGPKFNNAVDVVDNATIQSVINAAATELGSDINGIHIFSKPIALGIFQWNFRPANSPNASPPTCTVNGGAAL